MHAVVSRVEALERDLKHYFTGQPCKQGHVSLRNTKGRQCVACSNDAVKRWRTKYKDRRLVHDKTYRKRHPEKMTAKVSRQRATRRKATPSWANHVEILHFYWLAKSLTRRTGIPHHVDHIYPLRGENFCGLHVENNLQILTGPANRKKSNKTPSFDSDPSV